MFSLKTTFNKFCGLSFGNRPCDWVFELYFIGALSVLIDKYIERDIQTHTQCWPKLLEHLVCLRGFSCFCWIAY